MLQLLKTYTVRMNNICSDRQIHRNDTTIAAHEFMSSTCIYVKIISCGASLFLSTLKVKKLQFLFTLLL